MKRFLTMVFAFTLATSGSVLAADNASKNNTNTNYKFVSISCINGNISFDTNIKPNNSADCENNLENNAQNNADCENNLENNSQNNNQNNIENNSQNNADCENNLENNAQNNNVENETPNTENENNTPNVDNNTNNELENSDVLAIEKEVVELVNQERAKAGLAPLKIDASVSSVARLKSQDMADKNYFDHTSPTYGTPFNMLKQFNISYRAAGENIAKGQRTAAAVVDAWMNSKGHRENILNSSYTHIGVGYVLKGNTPYWTQMFISK